MIGVLTFAEFAIDFVLLILGLASTLARSYLDLALGCLRLR